MSLNKQQIAWRGAHVQRLNPRSIVGGLTLEIRGHEISWGVGVKIRSGKLPDDSARIADCEDTVRQIPHNNAAGAHDGIGADAHAWADHT